VLKTAFLSRVQMERWEQSDKTDVFSTRTKSKVEKRRQILFYRTSSFLLRNDFFCVRVRTRLAILFCQRILDKTLKKTTCFHCFSNFLFCIFLFFTVFYFFSLFFNEKKSFQKRNFFQINIFRLKTRQVCHHFSNASNSSI
jgi:hypothetical protein